MGQGYRRTESRTPSRRHLDVMVPPVANALIGVFLVEKGKRIRRRTGGKVRLALPLRPYAFSQRQGEVEMDLSWE